MVWIIYGFIGLEGFGCLRFVEKVYIVYGCVVSFRVVRDLEEFKVCKGLDNWSMFGGI